MQILGKDRFLDRARAENKVVTAGAEDTAIQQRFVVEIETTPTLESYIDELQNVNLGENACVSSPCIWPGDLYVSYYSK